MRSDPANLTVDARRTLRNLEPHIEQHSHTTSQLCSCEIQEKHERDESVIFTNVNIWTHTEMCILRLCPIHFGVRSNSDAYDVQDQYQNATKKSRIKACD